MGHVIAFEGTSWKKCAGYPPLYGAQLLVWRKHIGHVLAFRTRTVTITDMTVGAPFYGDQPADRTSTLNVTSTLILTVK